MALHLVVGAAHAGKSTYITREARAVVQRGERACLLLPSDPDVFRAVMDAAAHSPVGLEISTFDGFLDGVWEQHGDGRTIASPSHRRAVLEESVRLWQPHSIGIPSGSPGLVRLLASLVQRAGESAVPLDASTFGDGPASDLARAIAIYQRLLHAAGFIERTEAHRLAVASIGRVRLPALVAVDGFTSLTPAQEAAVMAAAVHTELFVSWVHSEAAPATSGAAMQLGRLERAGGLRVPLTEPKAADGELSRIAGALGTVGDTAISADGAVSFSEAWGSPAEAARVVREVQDAIEAGTPPGEILVVFRDVAPYLHEIRRALSEAGVPAEFDVRLPFGSTPLGRTLLLALDIDALEHHALMDLLRSPYSPASHQLTDEFDARERSRRGGHRPAAAAERWFYEREPKTAFFIRSIRRARARPGDAGGWYRLLSEMIASAQSGGLSSEHDITLNAATARTFIDAIEALAAVSAASRPDSVRSVLEGGTVAVGTSGHPQRVQVAGAERARTRRYRCVIVGGLRDGEFPRAAGEDALSDPSVVAAFATAGIDVQTRSGLDEERLLFYQVVTRATERLVLSRQTHDAEGRPLRGSVFVEELLDLYRDPDTREYFAGEPPVRRLGLDAYADQPEAPKSRRRALRGTTSRGGRSCEPAVTEARRRATRRVPALSVAAQRMAAGRQAFSASDIEAYLKCPYLWCMQRLVKPRELDERLDAAAAGRLAHEVLSRFYEAYSARTGRSRVTEDVLAEALIVHDQVAEERLALVRPSNAIEAVTCRKVIQRTRSTIEADATFLPGFAPMYHEWSFGMEPEGEPEDLGGFAIAGRVDRIDSDGTRIVLTDYKSGTISTGHGAARLDDEGLVQLPLYAVVASRRLGQEVAGAVYRSLRGGKPRGFVGCDIAGPQFVSTDVVTADELRGHVERGIASAAEAVSRMRGGDISPDPRGGTCPPYCPAGAFCDRWRPGRG